jgi:hypothetical protein
MVVFGGLRVEVGVGVGVGVAVLRMAIIVPM